MDNRIKKVLYTREQIEAKCKELGQWVDETYKGSKDLILVGLLKGCVPFMAQLMKEIKHDHEIDFMTVSTYHGAVESSGELKIVMDLKRDIKGKDVLLVEDIVDSGITLTKVVKMLEARGTNSVKTITLLDKPEGRVVDFKVDKYGFEVPKFFLVGFGLDVNEKLRNLPYVAIFDQDKLDQV